MNELKTVLPERIQQIQDRINTQDNCFTMTPLFCVYTRNKKTDPEDGEGWPVALFLTEAESEWYIRAIGYRLKHPYIYVRGPGEKSDLHHLIDWFREVGKENSK